MEFNSASVRQGAAAMMLLGTVGVGASLYPSIAKKSDVEALRVDQRHAIETLRSETQRRFELMELRILQESLRTIHLNISSLEEISQSSRTKGEIQTLHLMRENRTRLQKQINGLLSSKF